MIVKIVQKILEATNLHFGFGPVFGYLFRFTGLQNRTVFKGYFNQVPLYDFKISCQGNLLF